MDESLEKKIREAIADPKNMGELTDADRVGTVGNSDCGEMLRLWVKFKEDHGRKVICLLYTSPSPRDKRQSRMPSSA